MTILQHFEKFDQPFRDQAIKNLYPNMASRSMALDFEALIVGFYWHDTPEGFFYWDNYCKRLKQKHKNY